MGSPRLISTLTLASLLAAAGASAAPPPAPKQSLCERIYTHLGDVMTRALPRVSAAHRSKLQEQLAARPPVDKACAGAKPVPAEEGKCLLRANTLRGIKKCTPGYKPTKRGRLSKMHRAERKKMGAGKKGVDMNRFKKAASAPSAAQKKVSK